ncbi:unnamed protein product, partial [Rotaria sordida]
IAILKVSSNLTEEEIRDIYDDFKRQCPSGRMHKNQFLKCSKAFMESEDEKTDVPHVMFSVFDKNRDGTIDFSEFVLIIAMGNKEDLDSRLELVFEILDMSNDGRISYDEMMDFLEITKKYQATGSVTNFVPETVAKDMFAMFDLNNEQKISKQQFVEGCKKSKDLSDFFDSW